MSVRVAPFHGRAEYRLYMRADNADLRLTAKGYEAGIVSEERLEFTVSREAAVAQVCGEGGVAGEG